MRVERAGFGALQPPEHRVLDRVADMALLRHRIDQPERFRLARVDGLAGQHHRHRLHRIDELREAHGAAEAGMQAEHDLGKAEARVRRSRCASGRPARPRARRRGRSRGSRRPSESRSASSRSSTACARPISVSTARGSVAPRNSLTSAPAMKPDVFAERITRPVGPLALQLRQAPRRVRSITSADSVLALAPSRSNSSQAMPSASRVSLKLLIRAGRHRGVGPEFEHAIAENVHDFRWPSITPSRSAWRRPARRRCIRWRCRAACPAASWH